ncbi:T9SS type A sorting domain-containing protein [uncultured Winogradskyella sp.]|uniref:T9SS type A sorting domain-containing protein n=1 Tax=uncultured Winogradskyella sp. TaxID=395353 RepID=UPI00261D7FD7|nr:T9SS type A sorting domain-containing protein [uncultured Winogradskyella sp.]
MRLYFYKVLTILFICTSMGGFSQNNCIDTFDSGQLLNNNYNLRGASTNQLGNNLTADHYAYCGNNDPASVQSLSFPFNQTNNFQDAATQVTSGIEQYLSSQLGVSLNRTIGSRALKLNPTMELNISNRTTISRNIQLDGDFLNFDFIHLGLVPDSNNDHINGFLEYKLIDANNPSVILDQGCYNITNDTSASEFNLYTRAYHPTISSQLIAYTPNWVTHSIDLSSINANNAVLELTVSDCGTLGAEGQKHFSTAYIDNICITSCDDNTGSIKMDAFVRLNCPTENFIVSGLYENPGCSTDAVSITAYIAPYDTSNPNGTSNATPIATGTFNDSNFSFDINPNTLDFIPFQDYNIFVIVTFSDGSTAVGHRKYWELTFDDCDTTSNPCEDSPITINSEIPKCNDLNLEGDFSFEICGDYCADNTNGPYLIYMYLEILDVDNDSQIINTITTPSSFTETNYCFEITNSDFDNGSTGNYDFKVTALFQNSDGSYYEEDVTVGRLSFDDCQENGCELISEAQLSFSNTTGYVLSWENIPNATYELEFVVDYSCFSSPFPPLDDNAATFITTNNSISLSNDITPVTGGRSWQYRIRTGPNCPWTEWCCVAYARIDTSCSSSLGRKKSNKKQHKDLNLVSIYPNPATSALTIATDDSKIDYIGLYNIYGKPLLQVKNVDAFQKSIQTDRFARGYYVVKVTLKDGSTEHKNVILK